MLRPYVRGGAFYFSVESRCGTPPTALFRSETRFTVKNQEIYIKMEEMIMSQPKNYGLNELREMFLQLL